MNSEVVLSPEKTLVGAGSGPSCLESFIKRSVSSIPQVFQLIFFFSGTFALIMWLILFIVGKLVIFCGVVFGGFLCWLIAFLGGLIQEKVDKCNLLTCFPCIPNYIFFGKIYTRYIKSGPHSCSWKSKVTIKFYGAQDKAHQL